MGRRVVGLAQACHLGPVLVMTGIAATLVVALGGEGADAARLAVCVLLGQLSIGWSNDAHDAGADRAAGRTDKPVARGAIEAATVWRAAAAALVGCVLASFLLLGPRAGAWHVAAVAAAWAYNLRLKDTPASPVPYAFAFAAIPVIVSSVVSPSAQPPWSLAIVGALLGVAVHLANTAAEVSSDRSVQRGGLAVRLGSVPSRVLSVLMLGVAAAVLTVVLEATPAQAAGLAGLVGAAAIAAAIRDGAWFFPAVLVVTGMGVLAVLMVG